MIARTWGNYYLKVLAFDNFTVIYADRCGAFFASFDQRSKLSLRVLRTQCDIVDLSCVFVRYREYREYREYRRIKCCTKFAPKLHQHSTPIQLNKLEFDEIQTNLSFLRFLHLRTF